MKAVLKRFSKSCLFVTSMIQSFLSKLFKPIAVDSYSDPTEYLITTRSRQFQGLIVTQDNVIINLCDVKKKRIKILKANILTIAIVGNPAGEGPKAKTYHY